jgi:hypothetical protein
MSGKQTVRLFAFAGQNLLANVAKGTLKDSLLGLGHVAIQVGADSAIRGWTPIVNLDTQDAAKKLIRDMNRSGVTLPGHLTDDTEVFRAARAAGYKVLVLEKAATDAELRVIHQRLEDKANSGTVRYGFGGTSGQSCGQFLVQDDELQLGIIQGPGKTLAEVLKAMEANAAKEWDGN